MIDLKPCPFCGGCAIFVDYGQPNDFEDWNIECENCRIMFVAPGQEEGWVTTKEEVAKAWNRRQTMLDRETLHHALQDIADYFRECRKNAASGSAAEVRFERYVSAILEADKRLNEMERYDSTGNRARN